MSTRILITLNLLGLTAVLVMNYLSNALPLNGVTPAELSDRLPNLFVPSGLTFAIWGLIYSGLLVFAGVQVWALVSAQQLARIEPVVQQIRWRFLQTCALNVAWLLAWHWQILGLSVLVMCDLLRNLVLLNQQSGVGQRQSAPGEKWWWHAPVNLYQGWITIALIANVTAVLVAREWNGWGVPEATWTMAVIAVGTGVAAWLVWRRNYVFHGLAVAWALYGIWLKRSGMGDAPEVATVALSAAALVLVLSAARFPKWLKV
jgi:hypothetical protein